MKPTRDAIAATVIEKVNNITADWGLSADLGPHTKLVGDLGFTSMDVIDLFAMLDMALQVKLPYEEFVVVGEAREYRSEMSIGEIVAFVNERFDLPRGGTEAL